MTISQYDCCCHLRQLTSFNSSVLALILWCHRCLIVNSAHSSLHVEAKFYQIHVLRCSFAANLKDFWNCTACSQLYKKLIFFSSFLSPPLFCSLSLTLRCGMKERKPFRHPVVSYTETPVLHAQLFAVSVHFCVSVDAVHPLTQGVVHRDDYMSLCQCVYMRPCVCGRVCERVFFADGINWIMLWNTGCVGFRTSTDCILLSHDISIIISV